MDLKICSKCKIKKPLEKFYLRKTGPRSGKYYEKCRDCMKIRGRSYYKLNHDRQLALALKRRHKAYLEKRIYLNKIKNVPCADCGNKYPFYAMDFDHRDYKTKVREIAYMVTRNWSLDKIKREIEKCDIVCANCHRGRTYRKFSKKTNAGIAKVVTAGL